MGTRKYRVPVWQCWEHWFHVTLKVRLSSSELPTRALPSTQRGLGGGEARKELRGGGRGRGIGVE